MNRLYNSYFRIGGRLLLPQTCRQTPAFPVLSYVQTDGSYRARDRARVAVIIQPPSDKEQRYMFPVDANSSTEAEWASVAAGLSLAVERGCDAVALENDNLGIIRSLIFPASRLRHEYARFYRDRILMTAIETSWTGAQWIPREENKADELFRQT